LKYTIIMSYNKSYIRSRSSESGVWFWVRSRSPTKTRTPHPCLLWNWPFCDKQYIP